MKFFIVRHCKAEGQSPQAPLTTEGLEQAKDLAIFLKDKKIDRIISSPFLRAQQSIEELAKQLKITPEIDDRLRERTLSTSDLPDWYEKLKETFADKELRFPGGESSQEAMERAISVISDLCSGKSENIVLVTHGNLMSLVLNYYDSKYGFGSWEKLTNPDVFLLDLTNGNSKIHRIWK